MAEILVEKTEGLPDAEVLMHDLTLGRGAARWNPERDDFEKMVGVLNEIAPIQAYYLPLTAPSVGEAPLEIRKEWVGLRLPIRSKWETPEFGLGFTVLAREALEVLAHERPHADRWWRNHFIEDVHRKTAEVRANYEERHGEPAPDHIGYIDSSRNEFDEYLVNVDAFTFDPAEGVILPHVQYLGLLMAHDTFFAEVYTRQQAQIAS